MSEARERIYEVRDAQENTFHWVFDSDTVAFADWLQNKETVDKPIFWRSGKPGSGKSTLMKFAMRDARTLARRRGRLQHFSSMIEDQKFKNRWAECCRRFCIKS